MERVGLSVQFFWRFMQICIMIMRIWIDWIKWRLTSGWMCEISNVFERSNEDSHQDGCTRYQMCSRDQRKTHIRMDVREMGVLSKSKLLQLQIVKCETSIDDDADADAAIHDVDAEAVRIWCPRKDQPSSPLSPPHWKSNGNLIKRVKGARLHCSQERRPENQNDQNHDNS